MRLPAAAGEMPLQSGSSKYAAAFIFIYVIVELRSK